MKIELSDTAFLDLVEEKVRTLRHLSPAERERLYIVSDTNWYDDVGPQARVNIARQHIIDRVTAVLVARNVPRFLHTFVCPRCNAAWMADSPISRPLETCPHTACHEPLIAPRITEDRGR